MIKIPDIFESALNGNSLDDHHYRTCIRLAGRLLDTHSPGLTQPRTADTFRAIARAILSPKRVTMAALATDIEVSSGYLRTDNGYVAKVFQKASELILTPDYMDVAKQADRAANRIMYPMVKNPDYLDLMLGCYVFGTLTNAIGKWRHL